MIEQIASFKDFSRLLKVDEFGTRRVIPFEPNGPQRRLLNRIIKAEKDGRAARIIICKSRQAGFSTLVQAWLLHRAVTRQNFKALTVAHQQSNTGTLFEIAANMYLRLPDELQAVVYQKHQRRGNRILLCNDSDLVVETANDVNAGRGANYSALHLSEVAFWSSDASFTARSLRQTIQNLKGSLIVLESTPNGLGGFFYDEYMRAKEGASDYEAVFEPWYAFERNVMPVMEYHLNGQGGFKFQSDDEEMLQAKYNLTNEQMVWFRHTLANACGGDMDSFKQEFPSNDVDCFLSSGRLYFTSALVNKWTPKLPIMVGDVEGQKLVAQDKGPLWLYHDVEPGRKYVASIDPAGIQGDHHVGTEAEEDYSVVWVLRRHDMQTVAVWRDRVDPDVLAEKAVALGKYFNKAILAPEMNGEGAVVLFKIKDELRYPKLYRRIILDTRGEPETEKEGWRTTSTNRPAILAGLREVLRDEPHKLCDERLQREMLTFIIANAKPQAKAGTHDDLVLAASLAIQVASEHPHVLRLDDAGNPVVRPRQTYEGQRAYDGQAPTKSGRSPEFDRKYPK